MEQSKDTSVFIRINTEIELPQDNRNYLVTIEYPDGTLSVKKVYFFNNFKLKGGKKNCKVINWFKRIELNEDLYRIIAEQK